MGSVLHSVAGSLWDESRMQNAPGFEVALRGMRIWTGRKKIISPWHPNSVHTPHEQSSLGPRSVPSDKWSDIRRTDLAKRKEAETVWKQTWDHLYREFWDPRDPKKDLEVGLAQTLSGHPPLAHRLFTLWRGMASQSHPKAQDREPLWPESEGSTGSGWSQSAGEWHAHFHIVQHPQEGFTGAQHELQHQHLASPSLWVLPCRIIYPCMVLLLTGAHQANQLNSEIPPHLPPLYTINNHGVVETFPRSQGLSTERSNENSIQIYLLEALAIFPLGIQEP